jgi:hypothetical protein
MRNHISIVFAVAAACGLCRADRVEIHPVNYGFQFLEEPVNPRAAGAGATGVATPWGGFGRYNPAGGYLATRPRISLEYGQYPSAGMHRGGFDVSWNYGSWFWSAEARSFTVDGIYYADEHGLTGISSHEQQSVLHICGGYGDRNIGGGIAFNALQDRIADARAAYGWSLSLGGVWRMAADRLTLGAAVLNATEALKKISSDVKTTSGMLDSTAVIGKGAPIPLWGSLGAAWSDTLLRLPYTATAAFEYNDNAGRWTVPMGAEVWVLPQIAVRAGKRWGRDTELFSLGLGLAVAPVNFDLGFAVPRLRDDTELSWLAGVTYTLAPRAQRPAHAAPPVVPPADTATSPRSEQQAPAASPASTATPSEPPQAPIVKQSPDTTAAPPAPAPGSIVPADSSVTRP